MSRRIVIRWLLLGMLALTCPLVGCQRGAATPGPILQTAELQRYPEYGLRYPGADLVGEGGRNAENGPVYVSRATAGMVLGGNDSTEQIHAFYERELVARGWQSSNLDNMPSTADLDTFTWRKGSVVFRLATLRKHDPRNPPAGDHYTTPFSVTLIADDPRDPSWQRQQP